MHWYNENGSLCRYEDSRSTYVSYCDKSDYKEIRFLKKNWVGSSWCAKACNNAAVCALCIHCILLINTLLRCKFGHVGFKRCIGKLLISHGRTHTLSVKKWGNAGKERDRSSPTLPYPTLRACIILIPLECVQIQIHRSQTCLQFYALPFTLFNEEPIKFRVSVLVPGRMW